MSNLNRENILSIFLGFVVIWFGINEVSNPTDWSVFIPEFLGSIAPASTLVTIHGVVLILMGLAVIFNWHRRIGAAVLGLMILSIIVTLFGSEGLSEIVVRDIGLFGIALALFVRN